MAKGQRHIDDNGNVGVCRRTVGVCPFESRGHYDSREEAEAAYEAMHDNSSVPQSAKREPKESTPKTKGFSLEDGGYYGSLPPRTIQIEALNATANALLEDGNTQLVAACGTGKSYMGRQLMRRMMDEEDANGVAIVLTSSRKLAIDTAADLRPDANGHYDQAIGAYGEDYEVEVIEIHSDSKDGIKENGAVSPQKIADRWKAALENGKRVVIVSTYQSSDKVQQVQALIGEKAEADLLMNDEAHNVLGQKKSVSSDEEAENSGYRSFANEIPGSIQAKHRLYATATPPLADSPDDAETSAQGDTREEQLESLKAQVQRMKKNGKERLTVYSDDEHIVGKVSGAITQQDAIDNGYLTRPDYQLRAAVVKGNPSLSERGLVDHTGRYLKNSEVSEDDPRPMTAQTYSAVNATLQAMVADPEVDANGKEKNPVHNALAYAGSIEQAKAFRDNFRKVALEQSGNMSLTDAEKAVNSNDEDLKRKARLRMLAEHGEAVAAYSGETREAKEGRNRAFSMFKGKSFTEDEAKKGWNPHKKVLANVDIFSEGISINEIDTVVISDQSKTSERAMTQAIGRSLRTVGGNSFKSTGHVIIPQVLDENGKELNGGFVTAASYGATRVERAVSTRKLKGEAVPADESTFVARYDNVGKANGKTLAASIAKTHVSSADHLIASQVIERADNSLRSLPKGATPIRKAEVESYRNASKAEQAQRQRSFIYAQANNERIKDSSWAVADRALRDINGSDMTAVRQSGRVITSALSAGDFSAVPAPVAEKLSHAGIIRKRSGSAEPTISEKRELVLGSAESVVNAFVLKGGKEAHPDIAAYVSRDVDVKSANIYAMNRGKNNGKGSAEEFGKLVSNYKQLVNDHDSAAEIIFSSIEKAEKDPKPAPASLSAILRQNGGEEKKALWSGLSSLKSKVADRNAKAAAGGSADYELDPSMVSKNGLLKADAQKRLAEVL